MPELQNDKLNETLVVLDTFSNAHPQDKVAGTLVYDLKDLAQVYKDEFNIESFTIFLGAIEHSAEVFIKDIETNDAQIFDRLLNRWGNVQVDYRIAMNAVVDKTPEGKNPLFEDVDMPSTIERLKNLIHYCQDLKERFSKL